jgi:Mu-like prophage major head subunit gpT
MAVIATGNHPKALWPGVHAFVMGMYAQHEREYGEIFDMETSSMAYEEDVQIGSFGFAGIKAEGAATSYDTHQQGWTKRYTHVAYSLGYIVTREEIADNLYGTRAFNRAKLLANSFRATKETVAANVLNRAFNSSYTGGDGKELLATDHPSLSGNWQNELTTAADLSEASLEDMITLIGQAKNDRGLPIKIIPKKLIIPSNLWAVAERILKSSLQSGTANNDVNAIRSTGMLPGGAVVNHYLTDTDAWFIKTDAPDGMRGFDRQAFEFSRDNDFDTDNAKAKGYERYAFGWSDPHGMYGTPGA